MEHIRLTQEEIDALLKRVEANALDKGDYEIIKSMTEAIMTLAQALDNKAASIKRLLTMLFGPKTEKKDNVLKKNEPEKTDENSKETEPKKKDKKPPKTKPEKKKKGHGKIPASKYTEADQKFISHEKFKPKDSCPLCFTGKLYPMKKSGIAIYLKGQPPINATIYNLEKLRCNLCGKVFTAAAPEGITGKHYDETAKAMMAVLKYGYGFPWYRLEKLQESLGIPLPASTQWEKIESQADLIYPAFEELKRQAAQGEVLHNDDTTMKILDLIQENKTRDKDERTGIFTSGIISLLEEGKRIAIFYTGRNHAGENIASLYEMRDGEKDPPIQMCDSLSRNMSSEFKIILCHCITHARRGFIDVISSFPDECRHVIETLAEVYHVDAQAKEQNMTADQRLAFHQVHSGSLMNTLRSWLDTQIKDKLVEPNSGLGNAITYMIKHWHELTQFLRVPGAPLDNNICEQCLKRSILHRKNSMFYKTEHGAYIGDMFMSIIHTCNLMKVNALNYLISLQKHSAQVFKNPSSWMPWNYETAMGIEP
ncbi:IS66 family transposase [Desulfobacula toluolica]|uniref:Transposase, IS66 family n=1 Tax=Desulfobacula toluolica (strain DSM 7467 / Tol2) TaxID=651182 RepID=K0NHV6_DESTT|nr:IS66 family transposase [Desulfobacula toluolica]CCK80941.1 transposase, IS66 family [Desulfobacula toluolica Tol2]